MCAAAVRVDTKRATRVFSAFKRARARVYSPIVAINFYALRVSRRFIESRSCQRTDCNREEEEEK